MVRTILVTGAAGFIGAALTMRLLQRGDRVVGLDNLNDYYDPSLKQARLRQIEAMALPGAWRFERIALENTQSLTDLFAEERPQVVVNLAAQAGVRYSLDNPAAYIQSNLVGFGNVLEGCRHYGTENLVYASSSSVYGGNRNLPFDERQPVNHPVSLYAASKKANELMAHTYSHFMACHRLVCAFSPFMGPGVDLTWLQCSLPVPFLLVSRSKCSITARCSETSPISTILLRGFFDVVTNLQVRTQSSIR